MSQNNSNNDSEQENQHQPNFIPFVVNSDNEMGRKKSGKDGYSPEEPAEKDVGKAKDERGKHSNKKTEYILKLKS